MTLAMQSIPPNLVEMVTSFQRLSVTDRLILAKALLDSLLSDDLQEPAVKSSEDMESVPTLMAVVTQIKTTPPNPEQIQRATQTIDEVLENWENSPSEEPRLTGEEWEQNWWAIRQEMKQRDHQREPIDWIAELYDKLPARHESPLHNGH